METITLKIKNKTQLRHFMKLIKKLDYVEILPKESNIPQNVGASGDDFMAIAGMWQDRDISSETLRAKAWPKRR